MGTTLEDMIALSQKYEWADAVLGNAIEHAADLPTVMAALATYALDGQGVPFSEISLSIDPAWTPRHEHGVLAFWQADASGSQWAIWGVP